MGNVENIIMGCVASGSAVCLMIPMDTIKTRLVTQASAVSSSHIAYKGIVDCGFRMMKEEGIRTFYSGLYPRLFSVVPMMGIQFGVYEFMKKIILERDNHRRLSSQSISDMTTATTTKIPAITTTITAAAALKGTLSTTLPRIIDDDRESLFIASSYV